MRTLYFNSRTSRELAQHITSRVEFGLRKGVQVLTGSCAGIILEYEQADELRNKSIDLLNLSAE